MCTLVLNWVCFLEELATSSSFGDKTVSLLMFYTVHSPLFFRKIIEIESFALRATHLARVSKLPRRGGGLGGSERPPSPPPSYNAPSVHLKIKIAVTVTRGISKRSHQKNNVYASYRVRAVTCCHALRSSAGLQGFRSEIGYQIFD